MVLAEAEALKLQASLEDLNVWQMEKVKQSRKGFQDLHLTEMASWREGSRTRNVHLGSSRKMDAAEARQKAREMKAEALGYFETEVDDCAWPGVQGRAVRCKRPASSCVFLACAPLGLLAASVSCRRDVRILWGMRFSHGPATQTISLVSQTRTM